MRRHRKADLGWGARAGRMLLTILLLAGALATCVGLGLRWWWPDQFQRLSDQVEIYFIREWRTQEHQRFFAPSEAQRQVDVASLIRVRTPEQAQATRTALIQTIFESDTLPLAFRPTHIERNVTDTAFAGLPGIASIDLYHIQLPYGLVSTALHLKPQQPRGALLLYHEGQEVPVQRSTRLIGRLVEAGYHVVAFSMLSLDAQPVIDVPHLGPITMNYDRLDLLPRHLELFFLPVLAGMGQALDELSLAQADMIGFSSGGWVTTMMAALDLRIRRSFPVAGSSPMFLRSPRDFGARFEHWGPLYRVADYLDLYVLGSYGAGRSQTQILNQFDRCCFSGRGADLYARPVAEVVAALGAGVFRVMIDDSHADHRISNLALAEILLQLAAP